MHTSSLTCEITDCLDTSQMCGCADCLDASWVCTITTDFPDTSSSCNVAEIVQTLDSTWMCGVTHTIRTIRAYVVTETV